MAGHARVSLAIVAAVLIGGLLASGCAPAGGSGAGQTTPPAGGKLNVVATTNIVADVVSHVGGDLITLTTMIGPGIDPHTYSPSPANVAAVHDAAVVFQAGAGLEQFLGPTIQNAGGNARLVDLSQGIELRRVTQFGGEGTVTPEATGEYDPHVWFSVPNVIQWVHNIETALSAVDPAHAATYQSNAAAYTGELQQLDQWIMQQVAQVPADRRRLVTSHPVFDYFAARYGFEQVGAVYPVSPSAEPSARDISTLEDKIREYHVPAVFTESTVNPKLADQVARDTGVKVLQIYTDSLGGPSTPANSYIGMMRYDVQTIVDGLKGQ